MVRIHGVRVEQDTNHSETFI